MSKREALSIRPLQAADWDAATEIYRQGMRSGLATFETVVPPWDQWVASHVLDLSFVATADDVVVGWISVGKISGRAVFHGVVEVSVYVAESAQGSGVGSALLRHLIEASEAAGVWTLEAWIFPDNPASLALHERNGFRVVGTREALGHDGQRWRDVVILERRSAIDS